MPVGPYRLPTAGRDGVLVHRQGALVRIVHAEGQATVVRAWAAGRCVRFQAEAKSRPSALAAIERFGARPQASSSAVALPAMRSGEGGERSTPQALRAPSRRTIWRWMAAARVDSISCSQTAQASAWKGTG